MEVGWRILRCGLAAGLVLLFSVQRNVSIFTWSRYQDNEMIVPSCEIICFSCKCSSHMYSEVQVVLMEVQLVRIKQVSQPVTV